MKVRVRCCYRYASRRSDFAPSLMYYSTLLWWAGSSEVDMIIHLRFDDGPRLQYRTRGTRAPILVNGTALRQHRHGHCRPRMGGMAHCMRTSGRLVPRLPQPPMHGALHAHGLHAHLWYPDFRARLRVISQGLYLATSFCCRGCTGQLGLATPSSNTVCFP